MLYVVELNDKRYGVELTDDTAVLKEEIGTGMNNNQISMAKDDEFEVEDIPDLICSDEDEQNKSILATMSGTVISVMIKEKEIVEEGQLLAIYESMKMENEILAPQKGKVENVNIKKGDKIKIGQNLIVISGE